ncbi:MAG: hypothetical protein ABI601_18880 [bacterium]
MSLIRSIARLSALVLAVQVVASCDTRLPTSSGNSLADDVERPQIKFVLSGGTNNTVDVGAPLTVTVQATDNGGIATMLTRVSNAAQVIAVDTVSFRPVQPSVSRPITISTAGLSRGDRLTVRTTVADGALNVKTDSVIITIADTTGPKLTLSSTKSGRALKGGDTLDIRVTASDSSGIVYAGYRLLRVRATDSVTVKAESSFVTPGTRPTVFLPNQYSFIIPDTLLNGNYAVVGFALDQSGVATKVGESAINFTVIDVKKPTLTYRAPTNGAKLNIGDSLLITARLQDSIGIAKVTFGGISVRSPSLGILDTTQRYSQVSIPSTGSFRVGLRDTTVQRYIRVLQPVDTLTDSLFVTGILVDASNNADTVIAHLKMVNGPNVTFLNPILGDSATAGAGLSVSLRGVSSVGVLKLGFRAQSEPGWPTPLDTTITAVYSPTLKTAQMQGSVKIPANAPPKGLITLTPISLDAAGQDGSSAAFILAVRQGPPPAPRVSQTVGPRVETKDTIFITAVGNNVTIVGFEAVDDATGAVIKRDSMTVTDLTPVPYAMPLNFGPSAQGKKVRLRSFAYDDSQRIGYSVRAASLTQTVLLPAVDTALVVYGRTYSLPVNRTGLIADLVVDPARGNVFLSNINYGRLEVWQKGPQTFDPNGVIVGSQPWGMTMSRTAGAGDTLYVANSGGTNLSRVYVGAATPSGMKEDLARRLLTRVSFLYRLTEVQDPSTLKIRNTVSAPILFSDRPQFVEQSSSGRLYISTKPTAAAPTGTVRYLDPAAPAPDERFILAFATAGTDPNSWLIANVDFAGVVPAPATSTANDQITLCDHPSGSTLSASCVTSSLGIFDAITQLKTAVPTSDIDYGVNLDENSLGLSDTTFAASSGDGKWISFGEGNTKHVFARDFLLHDDGSIPNKYTYASPAINVTDLINNAADKVFGVALDKTGKTLGIHGEESYFAAVTQPFTQRLQGKKSTFDKGAGIVFHPNADGPTSANTDRLAFVASANGSIEVIDIAYYDFSRGRLATKYNLYGPLRASLPFAGDDPSVVFKLFGLAPSGLVVIDVTAADIAAGP